MSAGLVQLLAKQGFEAEYNSNTSFYVTDNKDMGLAAYQNATGDKEYYIFMKQGSFNQNLLNLEQVLINQGFSGNQSRIT